MTLAFHRYANLFPLTEGQEFYDLAEDIRVNGLLDRIGLIPVDDGEQILDGRNRYRALVWLVSTGEVLGDTWGKWSGEPLTVDRLSNTEDWGLYCDAPVENDAEALAYVLSKNLTRRHLDESQRAMVAADLATMTVGRPAAGNTANLRNLSVADAAAALSVSERSVTTAKTVRQTADPAISDAVKQGHLAVSAAAEIAAQPAERQARILADLPRDAGGKLTPDVKKALGPVIAELRAEKVAAKKEKRAERELTHGRKLQSLPAKTYGVAIEDFEWDHEPYSRETGLERHPSMHYETAADAHTPEEIAARCAERFACLAEDCILFKWATSPHLAIAIHVLELQGFRYVTSLVWNKERNGDARGPGYWFTGEHEMILVGVRGKVVAPAYAHFRSTFSASVGAHSEKPPNLHDIIEFHWPNTPKVEFNARAARPGWAAWGFDAPAETPIVVDIVDDFTALKALSDFCYPDRIAFVAPIAADYVARGLAFRYGGRDDWSLTEAGWKLFYHLDAERKARAASIEPAAQLLVELDPDELVRYRALKSLQAGEQIDGGLARDMVGVGYLFATTTKLLITEEGVAWLRALETEPVAEPIQVDLEEAIARDQVLDLPLFLTAAGA